MEPSDTAGSSWTELLDWGDKPGVLPPEPVVAADPPPDQGLAARGADDFLKTGSWTVNSRRSVRRTRPLFVALGALALIAVAAAAFLATRHSANSIGQPLNTRTARTTPSELVLAAAQALRTAHSFTAETTVSVPGNPQVTSRFEFFADGSVNGVSSTSFGSTPVSIYYEIAGGVRYVRAPVIVWSVIGHYSSSELGRLATHWVIVPSNAGGILGMLGHLSFSDQAKLLTSLLSSSSSLSVIGPTTVLGKSVVGVEDASGSVLWVAATGPPYPVETIGKGSTSSRGIFSDWNQGVVPKAPAEPLSLPSTSG